MRRWSTSPQRFIAKNESHYDVLPVIGASPAVQWIYDDLERLRLEFIFHQQFTNPLKAEQALQAIQQAHKAVPLVFGNGQHEGNFVITSLERTDIWRSGPGPKGGGGDIIAVQMVVELLQYGGALPVGAVNSIPDNTPALYPPPPAQKLSGVTSVPAQNIPAAPIGMQGTQLPTNTPLYPTIPKLPYVPSVGQVVPSAGPFTAVSLKIASRWVTGH